METLFDFGLQGLVAFGVVGVISYFKKDVAAELKLGLLVVTAFLVGFVPADLGNDLVNRVKDAVAVALGVHAGWKGLKAVGGQ